MTLVQHQTAARYTVIQNTGERWSCGRAPDCQSRGRWFNPTYRRVETYAISFTSHMPVSFGRDTKSRWSLLSSVYARGSKRSHTGGKCVTCSGLTNSRWTLNALQTAPSSLWAKGEKEKEKHVFPTLYY